MGTDSFNATTRLLDDLAAALERGAVRIVGSTSGKEADQSYVNALLDLLRTPPSAVQASSVPDGWKLVPIEPTRQMRECGADNAAEQYSNSDWEEAKDMAEALSARGIWRAMVEAAPDAAPQLPESRPFAREDGAAVAAPTIDTLRIDPRRPESAMSEGEKKLPELVMQARIAQLEEQLRLMTEARDYEKAAHQRTRDYYESKPVSSTRAIVEEAAIAASPLIRQAWADHCGIDVNDERVQEADKVGWPSDYGLFERGWNAAVRAMISSAPASAKEGTTK